MEVAPELAPDQSIVLMEAVADSRSSGYSSSRLTHVAVDASILQQESELIEASHNSSFVVCDIFLWKVMSNYIVTYEKVILAFIIVKVSSSIHHCIAIKNRS